MVAAGTARVALVARSTFVCADVLLELRGSLVLSATGSGVLTGSGV